MGLGTPLCCLFGGSPTLKKKRGRGVLRLYTQVGHRPSTETGSVVEGGRAKDAGRDGVSGFPALLYLLAWEGGGGNVGGRLGKEQVCAVLAVLCTAHCCTLVPPGMGGWRGKVGGGTGVQGAQFTVVPPGMGGSGKCGGEGGGEQVCTAHSPLLHNFHCRPEAHCCTPWHWKEEGECWGRDRCALCAAHCCVISTVG